MTTEILTERLDHTLLITLSGPATRNALSPQVYAAGVELMNVADADPGVRAVVLTGSGGHFCGGGDLQRLAHLRVHDSAQQARHVEAFHRWVEALRSSPKPVIAAVEGVAAGAGLSLALACDLVVASDNARFVTAYSRVGLSPDGGSSWHLARQLPRGQALAWLWAGDERNAHQLAAAGLVHEVVPAGTARHAALTLSERLAQLPQAVLASMKELVNDATQQALGTQLQQEQRHFMDNLLSPEAGAAIQSFLQRKKT
jgi:enoyl-CoA hydratase/carnithine racemase